MCVLFQPNATRVPAAVVPDTEPMAASSQDSGFDEETDSIYKVRYTIG